MKCSYCGSEIIGRPSVCDICGNELKYNDVPVKKEEKNIMPHKAITKNTPKKKKKKRKPVKVFGINLSFILLCLAVLAVIILVPVLIISSLSGGEKTQVGNIRTFYSKNSSVTSVVESGNVYEAEIEGDVTKSFTSLDGNSRAILTQYGELYLLAEGEATLISSGVRNYCISSDGSTVAYLVAQAPESTDETTTEEKESAKKPEKKSEEEETTEYIPAGTEEFLGSDLSLFIYSSLDGESKHIENAVAETSVSLSPTGKAVCYAKADDDGESFEGYICNDGVFTAVGRNSLPLAVTDDGICCYYVKYEVYEDSQVLKLFVKNGEAEEKLGEYSDGNGLIMYFNKDFTQTVYSVTGKVGNFFLWTTEKEKQKISSGFTPIYTYGQFDIANGKTIIAPVDDFTRFVFTDNEKTAKMIDKKYICNDLAVTAEFFRLTPDKNHLYFVDKNEYLLVTDLKKIETSDIASHVINFDISADGKMLYYVNSDKELHCYDGGDKVLSDNVHAGENGFAITQGGYIYYLKNYAYGSGTLCYIKNAGSEHIVEGAENVHDIIVDSDDNIYYRADYGTISGAYDLYYGKGTKFQKLFSSVG